MERFWQTGEGAALYEAYRRVAAARRLHNMPEKMKNFCANG